MSHKILASSVQILSVVDVYQGFVLRRNDFFLFFASITLLHEKRTIKFVHFFVQI